VSRLLTTSLALIWLVITYQLLFEFEVERPMLSLSTFSLFFLSVILVRGTSKFSATTGKILIIMSIVVIATHIISLHQVTFNISFIIPLLSLVTGLYIERINPHYKLYTWMFLGISAKVQFILIYSLITTNTGTYTILDLRWWWIIPAFMIVGVLMLMFHKFLWYRILVALTTIVGFVLTTDIVMNSSWTIQLLLLTLVAIMWPMITMRAVGRKIMGDKDLVTRH